MAQPIQVPPLFDIVYAEGVAFGPILLVLLYENFSIFCLILFQVIYRYIYILSLCLCWRHHANKQKMEGHCGDCKKVVKTGSPGTQCDLCQFWLHAKCSNVSKDLIDFLNSTAVQQASIHWYCNSCEKGSQKLFKQMVLIDKRLTSVEEKISELSDKLDL